jgi:hypothetical protein
MLEIVSGKNTLMQRNGTNEQVSRVYHASIDLANLHYTEYRPDGTRRIVGTGVFAHLSQKESK